MRPPLLQTDDAGPASFASMDGTHDSPPPAVAAAAASLKAKPSGEGRPPSVGRLNAAKTAAFSNPAPEPPKPEVPAGPGTVTLRAPELTPRGRNARGGPQATMR